MGKFKEEAKRILPPVLLSSYRKIRKKYGYFGNYNNWDEAKSQSIDFDSSEVIEKVKISLLKVINGEAICERDSVIYNEIQYSWPLLSTLLFIATKNNSKLNVIDFGGSLGSTYFMYKNFLSHIVHITWSVVELENFVICGKEYFENEQLKFYFDIESCLKKKIYDVIILSSVLPYLEKPYEFIEYILEKNFDFIIIDRNISTEKNDRITIQKVPISIYPAVNPAWILNKKNIIKSFQKKYNLLVSFDIPTEVDELGDITAKERGFIFSKINGSSIC